MKTKILENVNLLKDSILKSISECVSIESVISEPLENKPFGRNIDKALDYILDMCTDLGFRVYKDKEGYYGYAEIGEGDELVGILGHLDVVPAGDINSWKVYPFSGIIENGKIYGRGTSDDKGPTIASIYSLKAVLNSNIKLNKRVRYIFGTDEESLWRDMKKYRENNEEIPNLGFTPDSAFPCVNAEKGLLQCILSNKKSSNINFKAGDAFNAVPSNAIYSSIKIDELEKELSKLGFEYSRNNDSINIIGRSVHSKDCYKGINPIIRTLIALKNIGIENDASNFIIDNIFDSHCGEKILPNCEDISGKLTINLGKIDFSSEGEKIYLDIRIPVTVSKEDIVNKIIEISKKYGLEYEEYDFTRALYISEDHFLIKTLMKVYKEHTGFEGKPMSSGGATYARAIDNCVAFGALFPHSIKTEHQPNEYVEINDLIKATEIYALALYKLTR